MEAPLLSGTILLVEMQVVVLTNRFDSPLADRLD